MRRLLTVLLPLVGLAIFGWIVHSTGVDKIIDTFRGMDPVRLLMFPVFTLFVLWIRGLRWRILMRVVGIDYPLWKSSLVWAIGFFAASVTPGKIGDALRAVYLTRDTDKNLGECFLTVFIDRLMDLVTVLVFGIVTILLFSFHYIHLPSGWIIVIVSLGLIFVFYLLLRRDLMRKLLGPLFRVLAPEKYREEIRQHIHSFYDSLGIYAKKWPLTLAAYLLALGFWVGIVLLGYTVTRVLNLDVPLPYVFLIMPMITLVELIPISISGLGTREAAAIYFFSVIGISSAPAVGFSIMYLIAGTYPPAMIGMIGWFLRPPKFSEEE